MATNQDKALAAHLIQVGRQTYAYVQDDGTWWINNAGFVAGDDGVILIDTCSTEERTRSLLEAVRTVTDAPIRLVVNTHHHGDHTYGNHLTAPAAIVAHRACRSEALATGIKLYPETFAQPNWGDLQLSPPTVTFESRLDLWAGETLIELHHIGGPAHTVGDVVVWVPSERVLYTGDLVFHGGTPFVLMGSVEGSIRSLDVLRGFGARVVVPGHGQTCGPEVFDGIELYLRLIQRIAHDALERGLTPLEAARAADLGEFALLSDSERLVGNLHRSMAEISGLAVDESELRRSAIADMVKLHGQPLLPCSA